MQMKIICSMQAWDKQLCNSLFS